MTPVRECATKPARGGTSAVRLHVQDPSRPRVSGPRGDLWIVVLAGGSGTRLQSFTQQVLGTERPKQFCRIIGTRSMLRHTWDRALRLVLPERIITVITAGQQVYLEEEAQRGIPGAVLVQPENKETASGLILPLVWITRRNPVATVVVFPADHFIWEEDRFEGHVRAAVAAAAHLRQVILLGVEPEGPDTGYEYIAPAQPMETDPAAELYAVREFWEKPDWVTASLLFARGYFWNTFIQVGGLDAFLGFAEVGVPQVLGPIRSIAVCLGTRAEAAALAQAYKHIPPIDLSRVVLPRHPEALLVLAARGISWCDWGDPNRIVHTLRRLNRRPAWLPAYARIQAAMGAGLTRENPHRKENSRATV